MKSEDRTADAPSGMSGGGAVELVVLTNEGLRVVPLPTSGSLTVGRSPEADVVLDDGLASRVHARLHAGPPVELEDAQSANGTFLRGLRLGPRARVRLEVGDAFRVGRTQLILRAAAAPGLTASSLDDSPVLESSAMRELSALASQVARGAISVLLLGETGVGKDVTARLVHRASPRNKGPFVAINCPAISESLWESELFGHERGAFTGAHAAKVGLLEGADGGTVFLDEVGEIPLSMQAKLLRVLEDRTVFRVGAKAGKRVDVRFIAATNRELEQEVVQGRFRQDLFFRLSAATLRIPPLRERPEDLEVLAERFIRAACGALGKAPVGLSPGARATLAAHAFPGNVRELRNVLERAVLVAGEGPIRPEHLALRSAPLSVPASEPSPASSPGPVTFRAPPSVEAPPSSRAPDLRRALRDVEREQIQAALSACAGNQTRAAEMLGISRRALVSKLGEHELPRPRKRGE